MLNGQLALIPLALASLTLAQAPLSSPSPSPGEEPTQSSTSLHVQLSLGPGDRFHAGDDPISVRVRAYPPQGFLSYQPDDSKEWTAGCDQLVFQVPIYGELGIIAGSMSRGFTEQRLPAQLPLHNKGERAQERFTTLALPRRGHPSEVTLRTVFPSKSSSLNRASFRVILPKTRMAIAEATLTNREPNAALTIPPGQYEARIAPYTFASCGNSSQGPDWAQSARFELACVGGEDHELAHTFQRGSTFNVRFHPPAGTEKAFVAGTLRPLSPAGSLDAPLRATPRIIEWGSRSDAFVFPYLQTATDRVVFTREVFPTGEYVLTVEGPSFQTQEVPVILTAPTSKDRYGTRSVPIEVQLLPE